MTSIESPNANTAANLSGTKRDPSSRGHGMRISLFVMGVLLVSGCADGCGSNGSSPPTSQAATVAYDASGRLNRVEYDGGRTTIYEYDANGNVTGRRTTD